LEDTPAEQLPEMRNEIARAIEGEIKKAVNDLDGRPVILSSVELRNIDLPQKLRLRLREFKIAKTGSNNCRTDERRKAKQGCSRKAEIAKGERLRNIAFEAPGTG